MQHLLYTITIYETCAYSLNTNQGVLALILQSQCWLNTYIYIYIYIRYMVNNILFNKTKLCALRTINIILQ